VVDRPHRTRSLPVKGFHDQGMIREILFTLFFQQVVQNARRDRFATLAKGRYAQAWTCLCKDAFYSQSFFRLRLSDGTPSHNGMQSPFALLGSPRCEGPR
jgi:hypothetical protein